MARDIADGLFIDEVDAGQRDQCTDEAEHHTLDEERQTDHEVRRADHLHDHVLASTELCRDGDRVADQEDRHRQQYRDDHGAEQRDDAVQRAQSRDGCVRVIHLTNDREAVKPVHDALLILDVVQEDLVALGVRERVVLGERLREQLVVIEVIALKRFPGLLGRGIVGTLHLRARRDGLADSIDLLRTCVIGKEDGDADGGFCGFRDVLYVRHDREEQTEQEDAGCDGRRGGRGKQLVMQYVFKSGTDTVTDGVRFHLTSPPFLRLT